MSRGRDLTGYFLVVPALILVTIFVFVPFALGLWVSLTAATAGKFWAEFIGLENFAKMLTDSSWHETLFNALRALLALPIVILAPLVLAFTLYRGTRFSSVFRGIFFLSWLLPAVMVGYLFIPILSIDGVLNAGLGLIGLDGLAGTSWLGSTETSLWALLAVMLWTVFGLGVGIYLAGLATVSEDLFDAAKVDGAGYWRTLSAVTIPSIMPTIAFWTVVSTGGILLWMFPLIYSLTGGGPGRSSTLPEFYIWKIFGGGNMGYAAALGVVLFALVFAVALVQVWVMYFRTADDG